MNQPARTHPTQPRRQFVSDRGYLVYDYGTRLRDAHIVIWERHHGRPVPPGHHVHHRDGNKSNNDPANLELLTASEHMRRHALERVDEIREQARERVKTQPRDNRGRFARAEYATAA